MSLVAANITIPFDSSGENSKDRVFEKTGEETAGSRITFSAWALTSKRLDNLTLFTGAYKSLGTGALRVYGLGTIITPEIETLTFSGSNLINLQYPAYSVNSIAANTAICLADKDNHLSLYATAGSRVKSLKLLSPIEIGLANPDSKLYGTIKISYAKARYVRRWFWTVPEKAGTYFFFLMENGALVATEQVEVTETEGTGGAQEIVIVVKEYTSENVISGAAVSVDGHSMGITDENGTINIGIQDSGAHTVVVSKAGYVSSDEDDLENDSFVIE